MRYKQKKNDIFVFIALWTFVIVWLFYVFLSYAVNYTDKDQLLMWYATAHFAHGHFPEPCFFGQNYGSMAEALIAVPLYWLKWPFHYALPFVALICSILPLFFCSLLLWRKEKRLAACLLATFKAAMGWEFDLLTMTPRYFIVGITLVTIGFVLICGMDNPKKEGVGGLLLGVAFALNPVAIAFWGMTIAYLFLYKREKGGKWLRCVIGMAIGVILRVTSLLFYSKNDEYLLFSENRFTPGISYFATNISNLDDLFNNYIFTDRFGIVIISLAIICCVVINVKKRDWKRLVLQMILCGGVIMLLFSQKSTDYIHESIGYAQARMFLFVPYLVMAVFTVNAFIGECKEFTLYQGIVLVAVCICCLGVKWFCFLSELSNDSGKLYYDCATDHNIEMVKIESVASVIEQADLIDELVRNYSIDVITVRNPAKVNFDQGTLTFINEGIGYAYDALHYKNNGERFFLPIHDRRTWVYERVGNKRGNRMLLIRYPISNVNDITVVTLGEQSVSDWFWEKHRIDRYSWHLDWNKMMWQSGVYEIEVQLD